MSGILSNINGKVYKELFPVMKNCFYLIFVFSLLCLTSCREEIINPNNTGGNLNEPVLVTTNNSYSFFINAANISYNVTNSTYLTGSQNNLLFTVTDHSSGNINVTVFNPAGDDVTEYNLNLNGSGYFINLSGTLIDKIKFNFNNFSGKFKLEIVSSF